MKCLLSICLSIFGVTDYLFFISSAGLPLHLCVSLFLLVCMETICNCVSVCVMKDGL